MGRDFGAGFCFFSESRFWRGYRVWLWWGRGRSELFVGTGGSIGGEGVGAGGGGITGGREPGAAVIRRVCKVRKRGRIPCTVLYSDYKHQIKSNQIN